MSEYFVTHFINNAIPAGTRVESWPVHFSVIHPFLINPPASEDLVLKTMQRDGQALGPLQFEPERSLGAGALVIIPGETALFGPEDEPESKKQGVVLGESSEKLGALHRRLMESLGEIGCRFIGLNPNWSGANYNPHVTTKYGLTLTQPFIATTISLARKDDRGKVVVGTVDMYNQTIS
jgi:hypothetical protein